MEEMFYGCYICATTEGVGCVIFQHGIKAPPILCPSGYRDSNFIPITKEVMTKLKGGSK